MSTKIFLSWSKNQSKEYALIFNRELKILFPTPGFEIFMSDKDISMGSLGITTILDNLSSSEFGIFFITEENQGEPWLNFEAGALSKGITENRVIPIGFDGIEIGFLNTPLKNFQGFTFGEEKFKASMKQINAASDASLADASFDVLLASCWNNITESMEKLLPKKKEAKKKDLDIVEGKLNLIISELSKVNNSHVSGVLQIRTIADKFDYFDSLIKQNPDIFDKDAESVIRGKILDKDRYSAILRFVVKSIRGKFKEDIYDYYGKENRAVTAQYIIMFFTYYLSTINENNERIEDESLPF